MRVLIGPVWAGAQGLHLGAAHWRCCSCWPENATLSLFTVIPQHHLHHHLWGRCTVTEEAFQHKKMKEYTWAHLAADSRAWFTPSEAWIHGCWTHFLSLSGGVLVKRKLGSECDTLIFIQRVLWWALVIEATMLSLRHPHCGQHLPPSSPGHDTPRTHMGRQLQARQGESAAIRQLRSRLSNTFSSPHGNQPSFGVRLVRRDGWQEVSFCTSI